MNIKWENDVTTWKSHFFSFLFIESGKKDRNYIFFKIRLRIILNTCTTTKNYCFGFCMFLFKVENIHNRRFLNSFFLLFYF